MKDIDWTKLTFSYTETDYIVRCRYEHGAWGELVVTQEKTLPIHVAAAGLQYAQQCFEGLKAYRRADGTIGIFRPIENALRMQDSARAMYMPLLPTDTFIEAVTLAVKMNLDYLPPYGTGATLYIRPIMFGITPKVGVAPAEEFEFCIVVTPIGPYFPTGFGTTPFIINRHVDRAAPLGTGQYKVGGNYASSFRATEPAHEAGVGVLFLDSAQHLYLDECGGANIFLVKDGTYCTPKSDSILPSIINRSLMQLCRDLLIPVEERRIPYTELGTFTEAAACGTGAAISPISRITDPDNGITYHYGEEPGPVCKQLYKALRDIQFGRVEDAHNWCYILD